MTALEVEDILEALVLHSATFDVPWMAKMGTDEVAEGATLRFDAVFILETHYSEYVPGHGRTGGTSAEYLDENEVRKRLRYATPQRSSADSRWLLFKCQVDDVSSS